MMFVQVLLCSFVIRACDACACSSGNIATGLLTDYRSNFVRLGYFYSTYTTAPEHTPSISDHFHLATLSLRYAVGKSERIKLTANMPFRLNTRNTANEDLSRQGWSDLSVIANYALINPIDCGKKTTLYAEIGGGVSLPSGKFDSELHEHNLPENFNIGKGCWGYIAQTNAVLTSSSYGLLWSCQYQINAATSTGYRFGQQMSTQGILFKEIVVSKIKWIPNVGVSAERSTNDHYANGNEVPETGGYGVFFSSALNLKTTRWLGGVSFFAPLATQYAEGNIEAKPRWAGSISYLF